MAENHSLSYYPDTVIAFKKLEGQIYRLESAVSYECLAMIPARVLVLSALAYLLY